MELIKQEVLDFIKFNGPVLPFQVAKKIEKNLILAGALLSDLISDKLVKISRAKIGGSPVYYVSGQEEKLEKLYEYLPGKEKEAFNLLKEKRVLKDKEVPAGIRVALRSIRDFAFPFKYSDEIYWRWYLLPEQEIGGYLPKVEPIKPINIQRKPAKKLSRNEFFENVRKYSSENNIEIIKEKLNKRNEIGFVTKINSDIGNLKFLLIARNKKKINDADLSLAYSKGHKLKLPVIFLTPGSLTKKATKYLEENKGYVIFKSMN